MQVYNIFMIFIILIVLNFILIKCNTVKVTMLAGKCKEYPNVLAHFTNIRTREENGVTYIKQALRVTKQIDSIDKIVITSKRCHGRDDLDHCETFRNLTIPAASMLLSDPNNMWSKKLQYDPPLTFPLKPGTYTQRESVVDTKWSIISAKGYWREFCYFISDAKVILCYAAEGEIY